MENKRKNMCATCIYRTNDKEYLSLPRETHECHEDSIMGSNQYAKLCAGSAGERGSYEGSPMFADKWAKDGLKILEVTRHNRKKRLKEKQNVI